MKKMELNKGFYIKMVAGAMTLVLLGSMAGCKGKTTKKEIEILPQTGLEDLIDAVKDQTTMDEYVKSNTSITWFDYTDLENLENEDMAEVNERIYELGINELKGAILDAVEYPLELVKDVKFKTPEYVMEITINSGSTVTVKVSSKNISDLVSVINIAKSSAIRRSDSANPYRDANNAYNIIKNFALYTGHFDNKKREVAFELDSEKVNAAKDAGLVLTNQK